mgnify:CR=1 FL=1
MCKNSCKVVFLDRDGTMNVEVNYLHRKEDLKLIDGTAEAVRLLNEAGYKVIVITNQADSASTVTPPDDDTQGIANHLIAQGKPVICMTMIDLLERIKRTYSTTGGSESDVLKIYKTVPLLVIDDIGKEPPTEWAISTVYNFINGRYEAYLPTIVTTNYDTEALIDRMTPRESRDSMTARATIDRLMEMCRGITLTGQSWRSR